MYRKGPLILNGLCANFFLNCGTGTHGVVLYSELSGKVVRADLWYFCVKLYNCLMKNNKIVYYINVGLIFLFHHILLITICVSACTLWIAPISEIQHILYYHNVEIDPIQFEIVTNVFIPLVGNWIIAQWQFADNFIIWVKDTHRTCLILNTLW